MNNSTLPLRLSPADRQIVIFHVWQSLAYPVRMLISFVLVITGILIQLLTNSFLFGAPVILAGNLLLLVKGYDNRVSLGRYDPAAQWEVAEHDTLEKLFKLDKKIKHWDLSLIDVSNATGLVMMVIVLAFPAWLAYTSTGLIQAIALDALILLLPHWLTGTRRILLMPKLLVKAKTLKTLINDPAVKFLINDHDLDIMVLLKGSKKRFPNDLKIRLRFKNQHEDFLGLYGQVVINEVQGTSYPYFYVVLVAKKGYGLFADLKDTDPNREFKREYKIQDDVEVLIIRQHAVGGIGYHTKPPVVKRIFQQGFRIACRQAVGP